MNISLTDYINIEMLERVSLYLHTFSVPVVFIRLLLAFGCGGIIGFFRSVKRRGAGFKTHIMVCLGAALIMMTGEYIFHYVSAGSGDVARLAAQVVSGVGFLGAGTIIVTGRNQVKGLTTAAGLWASSGIGLAIGIGFYSGALFCTFLVLLVYRYMERVDEFAYEHSRVYDLCVTLESRRNVSPFLKTMKNAGYKFLSFEINKSKKNVDDVVTVMMVVEAEGEAKKINTISYIQEIEGVCSVEEV